MFGLTKREQRWKAEQKAAETLLSLIGTIVVAVAQVRIAEAQAEAKREAITVDRPTQTILES